MLAIARKSGKSPATERAPRKSIGIAKPKKLFSYKKLSSTPEKRGKFNKTHKAIFNLVRAKYQKGDKKDALTGVPSTCATTHVTLGPMMSRMY